MIAVELLEKQTTTEWLPVGSIGIDMRYQRALAPSKVKAISARFNEVAAGTLAVNLREDGQYVVIDGQHRLEAMKKCGILFAECKVCRNLTLQQEAEIYVWCNTVRKSPNALDTFRARLVEGDPVAIAIDHVVTSYGLHIQFTLTGSRGGKRQKGGVWAITALEEIYVRGKEKLLEEILTLATRSWPDTDSALEAKVLLGITTFHVKYKQKYSREDFIAKMNVTDLNVLRRRAQYHAESSGGSVNSAFAKALQEAYDKGRRIRRLESK